MFSWPDLCWQYEEAMLKEREILCPICHLCLTCPSCLMCPIYPGSLGSTVAADPGIGDSETLRFKHLGFIFADTPRLSELTATMTVWRRAQSTSLAWARRRPPLASCWATSPGRRRTPPRALVCPQSWRGGKGAGRRRRKRSWEGLQLILQLLMVFKFPGEIS